MSDRNMPPRKKKANNTKRTNFIIRKMQPSLPTAANSTLSGPNLVIDFFGSEIAPDKREVFASIVLNRKIALDINKRINNYLEYLETYQDEEDDEE